MKLSTKILLIISLIISIMVSIDLFFTGEKGFSDIIGIPIVAIFLFVGLFISLKFFTFVLKFFWKN